jgi:methyl-accepting chemotaxis protein
MVSFIKNSIRTKLLLAVACACLLVAIALAVALTSLLSISNSFSRFVEQDQVRLQAFSNMYAQGLQGGQAVRNIVLNPNFDKKALLNLEKSHKDFDDAFQQAVILTKGDPVWRSLTADIGEKWKTTLQARKQVLDVTILTKPKQSRF